MNRKPRVILDTNVIVSALVFKASTPRQAMDKAFRMGRVAVSWPSIMELQSVLRRFEAYVPEDSRMRFLAGLIQAADVVPIAHTVTACRDPRDNLFLELALSAEARALVTGDADLLSLHPFHGIPVVTPRAFLSLSPEP